MIRASKSPLAGAVPAGFFVLRAPLLPFSTLTDWGTDLETPRALEGEIEAAFARDTGRLLERLKQITARPEVREAVFCASPTLDEAVAAWLADPASPRAAGVTNILVRYVSRMAGRATPFGLFSRCGVGRLEGGPTRLSVATHAEVTRHTRLDMHYLTALVQHLERRDDVRRELHFFPSTGLYHLGDFLHYVEATYEVEKSSRSFKLVAVEAGEVLEEALSCASAGARTGEIAGAVRRADPSLDAATAADFVSELIDSQLLVSELSPPITGPEPIHHVIHCLEGRGVADDVRATLESVRDLLAEMDGRGVGQPVEGYRAVASALSKLPAKVEPARLFQVDLAQGESGARIGPAVVRELERGVALLQRLAAPTPSPDLEKFCAAFRSRYEAAEVPLCVALDEELGVGFGATSAVPSPLIDGLPFRPDDASKPARPASQRALLLRRILERGPGSSRSWELSELDIRTLAPKSTAALPDSSFLAATVAARTADDLEGGDFRILLEYLGAGAARMFGRFCHGDPVLHQAVREQLRAEERLVPDAVFAEIVHLPEGRTGNILCRPVLRDYEIPFVASPGVDPDHAIGLDDLLVWVEGDRVHLRSKRLGRQVIPRMTNAHNPQSTSLSIYRFLCAVADQAARHAFAWSWGELADAPHLPRVTHGKLVLALESWVLATPDVEALKKETGVARYRAVQGVRARLGLPRWIAARGPADHFVPVDLDNVLSVENWVDMLRPREEALVTELFPGPEELAAHGADGRYVCEIIVPFTSNRPPSPPVTLPALPSIRRTFEVGSEWLFVKIYSGPVTADAVLREIVGPVVRRARERGVTRWFFIRYSDPQNHLRVRLRGDATLLLSSILPDLRDRCAPWIARGRIHKLVLDTYEREIERYGGDHGMDIAEEVFFEDSEAVLRAVTAADAETEADTRWRLALLGMDLLLSDLGLDLQARLSAMRKMRDSFAREHGVDTAFERELGNRFRSRRAELEALLEGELADQLPGLSEGARAFATRTERLAPTMRELRSRAERGMITVSVESLASSLLHMHANRMLIADHRAQELVLYDCLLRLYESRAARSRQRG